MANCDLREKVAKKTKRKRMTSFLTGLASVLSGGVREHFPLIRVKNIYQTKHLQNTQSICICICLCICRCTWKCVCMCIFTINIYRIQMFTMTQKVEDMASEFLLTFLAVLVQLGLPARQNQTSGGKELGSGYTFHRSEMHFDFKTISHALLHFFCWCD